MVAVEKTELLEVHFPPTALGLHCRTPGRDVFRPGRAGPPAARRRDEDGARNPRRHRKDHQVLPGAAAFFFFFFRLFYLFKKIFCLLQERGEFTDLDLYCSGGARVSVHRWLLARLSPELAKMLGRMDCCHCQGQASAGTPSCVPMLCGADVLPFFFCRPASPGRVWSR